MVIFFCFENNIRLGNEAFGFAYEYKFEAVPLPLQEEALPYDKIYFSTPSDFQSHIETIKAKLGDKAGNIHVVNPPHIVEHPDFPKHIGFCKEFETAVEACKKQIKDGKLRLAVLNAMSNAIGDHLIGMQAFDYFHDLLQKTLGVELEVSFYQLNPYRVGPITKQWNDKFQHLYVMPNRLSRFMEHDVFIDMGTLLLRENFDDQPMIDFFFQALSIDPASVPDEKKRMKFKLSQEALEHVEPVIRTIRAKGRPILLLHRTSTSPIRQMSEPLARQFVRQIIENSDYFVISADQLEYQNDRFMCLSEYSQNLEQFAGIISLVDAIITVDTSTYHIADAFDKPTVVLFTSIEPKYRMKYYPFTRGIMLEEKGGLIYGQHKLHKDSKEAKKQLIHVNDLWSQLKVADVLETLNTI